MHYLANKPLGGLGIVIGLLAFLFWHKSIKGWQKVIAWIGGIWAAISIVFYSIAISSIGIASTSISPTVTPVRPTSTVLNLAKAPSPTEAFLLGKIRVDKTNIRSGAGTQFSSLGKRSTGTIVTVVGKNVDGSWIRIRSNGVEGWVSAPLLEIAGDVNSLPAQRSNEQQALADTLATNVAMRLTQQTPIIRTPTIQSGSSVSLCKDTANKAGQKISCKIPRAYCSYQPSTSGSPTFCNDARYPNNDFTLLVWGEDWSDYDGACIIVSGYVSLYGGKPQIEASSRSQVSYCP